jgi:hypothetical protein
MSDDEYGMVECPTCAGSGLVTEQHYDETLAALDLAESIPADRLNPWHTVTIDIRAWHIAHGVLCDLATCPFDAQARKWAKAPVAVGVYRWHDPHGPLVPEGADDGPTE